MVILYAPPHLLLLLIVVMMAICYLPPHLLHFTILTSFKRQTYSDNPAVVWADLCEG